MNIIIYGFGSFAKLMHYYQTTDTKNNVVAFCVDDEFKVQDTFCNLPVVEMSKLTRLYEPSSFKMLVAVGYSNMRKRVEMYEKVKILGYQFINYINSNAFIDPSVKFGMNNIVLPGTVIEPYATLGNNNILWSSVNISHDVNIQSHSFIASKSTIGGFSQINHNCFLGFNSVISSDLIMFSETLIGANSLMLTNSKTQTKYWGNPAKNKGTHKKTGIIIK